MPKARDFTGVRRGRFVAMRDVGFNGKQRLWLVKCDCGNEKIISAQTFCSPDGSGAKSCGCLKIEHGRIFNKTHGLYKHRLYTTWRSMRARCINPKATQYKNYGGRGINIHSEWDDFGKFVSDMAPTFKEGLTLDRMDNNDGYNFGNCRWATPKQQQSHRIKT